MSGSGSCGQTVAQTGYLTKYTYDVNNNILTVTQNAQSSSTQTRTYAYDGLSRLTSEANPETTGTAVTYTYDTDSTCGTSHGDLVKKIDAVGNVVCHAYDALHRNTSITYPSGSYASVTPSKTFVYDAATVNSVAMANAKGRLAEAYTGSSKTTDLGFSYSVRGEVANVYQSSPHSGGYYNVAATYWANGLLNTLNANLSGIPTWTYVPDGEGRVDTVTFPTNQYLVSGTSYNGFSEPTSVIFGSSDADDFVYDGNTGRMTQYQASISGSSMTGTPGWNSNWTLGSLTIADPFNSANAQTCNYTHDDLARLANVNCGTGKWIQAFSYDAFGNISKTGSGTGFSFQPTYTSSTNRYATLPNGTPAYDANGNLTNDSFHTYAWDSDANLTTLGSSTTLTSDALDRRVEQTTSGTSTEILYGPGGTKLALMNGTTVVKAFAPLSAGATAVYTSSGLAYYRHPDWLGSSRIASTPSRTVYYDGAYAPFGENYAETGTTDRDFTGQNQDMASDLYDFLYREYHPTQGRWIQPDPAGLSAVDATNPQTWNRYGYVVNLPDTYVDAFGLESPGGGGGSSGTPIDGEDELGNCLFQVYLTYGDDRGAPGYGPAVQSCYRQPYYVPSVGIVQINYGSGVSSTGSANNAVKQTFPQCMAANSATFSIAGLAQGGINVALGEMGTPGVNFQATWWAQLLGGDALSGILFGSSSDAATSAGTATPGFWSWQWGKVRRTADAPLPSRRLISPARAASLKRSAQLPPE